MKTYIKIILYLFFIFIYLGADAQGEYINKEKILNNTLEKYKQNELIFNNNLTGKLKGSSKSSATLTITDVAGTAGSSVLVPVSISNVTDLAGFQWTIEYDATKLTYVNCTNWDATLPSSVTVSSATSGKLTFVYSNATGVNITAGTFFELNFDIDAGAVSGVTNLIWSDNPTSRWVNDATAAEITTTWNNGSITITGLNPTITIEDVVGVAGSPVVVPVNALNLVDLIGFQWTIDYDETKLSYINCTNWDAQVTGAVTIHDDGSVLTFAYNDYPNAIDIADGKFFNLNFDVLVAATGVAPVTWSDSPTVKELSNSIPAEITGTWVDGSVTISATSSPTITIEDVAGVAGTPVVVPVNALNLVDLIGFQWTIDYDQTKLTYVNCTNWDLGAGLGSVTINDDAVNGILTFAYNDYPNAINIADGKFFDLNFDVLGGASGIAPVVWSDNPTVKELSNSTPIEIIGTWVDGSVTISATSSSTITIEDVAGVAGSPVVVPVNALNLVDLIGFQWTIDYDETKLSYINCTNWDAQVTGAVTIHDDGSVLTFAYNDYPNAIDIADGKFFNLNFDVLVAATGVAPVTWSDSPTVKELSNSIPAEITGTWVDGSVTISATSSPTITIEDVAGVAGTPVVVPVNALNLVDLIGFQWTIDYDQTKLTYVNCTNWDLGAGLGSVTINDDAVNGILTFAYNDYPNAINIADGKFFDLNFDVLGGASGIAPVVWSDSPTVKELSNSTLVEIIGTWVDGSVIMDISWDGSTDTNWQDVTNWTPEFIPRIINNITIPDGCPNYPIVNDNPIVAVYNNMIIQANSSVQIAINGQMTAAGIITNNAGVSGIIIKSDATGDGSLIMNNTGVNATVERYLSKTIGETGQWHFLGSPITAAPLSLFNTNNFYQYNENADDWWTGPTYFYNNPSGWQVPAGNLNVGQGYIYYYYEETLSFEGEINYNALGYGTSASYTTHAGNAANGNPYTNFDGWLLVSNPYPSALDWTKMDLTNVNNTVYFYDDGTDNYKYYTVAGSTYANVITVNGGSQYIASGQGFFVKSDNALGGTFTIPNTARVHNTQAFWKGSTPKSPDNLIRLQIDYQNYTDEMVVHFNDEATTEFDGDYDAYKRFSWNADVPQIYTLNNDKNTEFAINTSKLNLSQVIPLGYKVATTDEYTIRLTELTAMNFDYIYLEDLNTGALVNLFEQSEYKFIPENTEIENDRFLLHFGMNQTPVNSNIVNKQAYNVYPNPSSGLVNIYSEQGFIDTKIIVSDITGRKIYENNVNNSKNVSVELSNYGSGVYLISIIKNDEVINKRVVIE